MKRIARGLAVIGIIGMIGGGMTVYAEENDGFTSEKQQEVTTYETSKEVVEEKDTEQRNLLDINKKSEKNYEIQLKNAYAEKTILGVKFAVWSEVDGQDDIRWYEGRGISDKLYQYEVSLDQHKGLGTYNVHVYAETDEGLVFLTKTTFETKVPDIQQSESKIVDLESGVFHVSTKVKANNEYLDSMMYAVWSKVNGQDDIQWYQAKKDDTGEYSLDISIKNHKYSLGDYNIHVYARDITGRLYYVDKLIQNIDVTEGKVSIENGENPEDRVTTVENYIVPGGIKEVLFPTWSEKNGQDDIQWYQAKYNSQKNCYQNTFSLKNHRGLGTYKVHAYARTNGGELVFIGSNMFAVESPQVETHEIKTDEKNGTYQVIISGIMNEEYVEEILVPTWSEENGQDDIIWYTAKKNSKGQYVVNVDIKNHKYTLGTYISHIYIRDITGELNFQSAINTEFKINLKKIECKQGENDKTQFTINIKGLDIPGEVSKIYVPVWSEVNGQDDIQWYIANKKSNGDFQVQMSLKKHKGLGKYNVHVYAQMPNGKMNFCEKTTFTVEEPKVENIKVSELKKDSGEFQVLISNVEHSELIQSIQVPIWSQKDQSDIVWYTAKENQNGDYVLNVNISNHNYNPAMYKIHTYLTDITGFRKFVGAADCDMSPSYAQYSVQDMDGTESTYRVSLEGLNVPAKEKGILFAVWGENSGQNDLKWYHALKNSDGNYYYDIKIRNHKELGTYQVHAYCETKSGKLAYIGATSFSVNTVPTAAVNVSEINGTDGTFKVKVSVIGAKSGIEKVQVPVWCAADQSDIVWYQAIKQTDGTYSVVVKVKNHGHHFGAYNVHAYVTMGNGIMSFAGATNCSISPLNYVYSMQLSATTEEVGIMGASASRVQFPTWSNANGQDDVIWYEGTNRGYGKWNAVVNSANHNDGGAYTTHVYITDESGTHIAGATSYSLNRVPTEQGLMLNRANLYNSSTPYLILVNRSTHKVGIFQGWQGNWKCIRYWNCSDGAPSTPTVEGRFTVGIRGYYFDSGASRCYWYTQFRGNYLFHSVLYNKNGTLRDGRLGMPLSHGCVRLDINNAKWIYDTIPSGTTVVVYH